MPAAGVELYPDKLFPHSDNIIGLTSQYDKAHERAGQSFVIGEFSDCTLCPVYWWNLPLFNVRTYEANSEIFK